eukprot:gene9071-11110_t
MVLYKWDIVHESTINAIESSFLSKNHIKVKATKKIDTIPPGTLIQNRNSFPGDWRSLFIEREYKYSLCRKYYNINLFNYKTVQECEEALENAKRILNVPALNRSYYLDTVKNETIRLILDSVLYSSLTLNRKHFFGGIDDGMGMKDTARCIFTLLTPSGKLLECKIVNQSNIIGGHDDLYESDGYLEIGIHRMSLEDLRESKDYQFLEEKIVPQFNNPTKPVDDTKSVPTNGGGGNPKIQVKDIKTILKWALPYYILDNPYFEFLVSFPSYKKIGSPNYQNNPFENEDSDKYQNKIIKLKDKLEKEKIAKIKEQKKCEEQRLGRTRAEIELRRVVNSYKEDRENKNTERPPDYPPIGFLESCFRERNGTPRQGNIVTKGKAILRLRTSNTNTLRGVRQDRPSSGVKAKVAPPRLDGVKVGLFSTRTPHRPNPIGLSVAKIDKVVGNAIYLSGIDLIDGTPILDVKPYSVHDSIDSPINPKWVTTPVVPPLNDVIILEEAKESLRRIVESGKLKFYDNYQDIETCIIQVLTEDIRSVRKRKSDRLKEEKSKQQDSDQEDEDLKDDESEKGPEKHRFSLDILNVRFTVENQIATVFEIHEDIILNEGQNNIYQPSKIYKNNGSGNEEQQLSSPPQEPVENVEEVEATENMVIIENEEEETNVNLPAQDVEEEIHQKNQ